MPWEHRRWRPATRKDVLQALKLPVAEAGVPKEIDALVQAVNRLSFRDWENGTRVLGVDSRSACNAWHILAYPQESFRNVGYTGNTEPVRPAPGDARGLRPEPSSTPTP